MRMRIATTTDMSTDAVRSWEAEAAACSLSLRPMYWLITTAPPVASATKRFRNIVLKELMSETPETADSPTKATTKTSAMPTDARRSCSRKSGMMSFLRSAFVNANTSIDIHSSESCSGTSLLQMAAHV
jgi:hypothetical protein